MPLSLQSLDFAIICDGHELETFDAKQDGPNSIQACVASEAGKVIVSLVSLVNTKRPTIMTSNSESSLAINCSTSSLHLACISTGSAYTGVVYYLDSGARYKESQRPSPQSYHSNFRNCNSLVRSLIPEHPLRRHFHSSYVTEDPDVEDAPPVVPEMGTIELRVLRCRAQKSTVPCLYNTTNGLHQGRVSERSKKAGWHHVR
jgi:hypothetical protein